MPFNYFITNHIKENNRVKTWKSISLVYRDGVRYIILTFDETDAEELFMMAEELFGGK